MPQKRFTSLPGKDVPDTTDKYVTYNRQRLIDLLQRVKPGSMPVSTLYQKLQEIELPDAVVIRRQDLFAAPALNGYASSMAIAIAILPDGKEHDDLLQVADYFHQQSVLAGEEGFKLPTL